MKQEQIKNPDSRKNLRNRFFIVLSIILLTVFGIDRVGFSPRRVDGAIDNLIFVVSKFFPEDYFQEGGAIEWTYEVASGAFIESIQVGVLGAIIGCILAYPLCLFGSKLTAPNKVVLNTTRTSVNVIRTMPELFWVILATTALGFGPFAGLIAIIIFVVFVVYKMFTESIDALDPGPLEALNATGATYFTSLRHSVVKEINPIYFALCIFMLELSIRVSAVIGLVGAGGIGQLLNVERVYFHWDNVSAIVLAMTAMIVILEIISTSVRSRLLR